MGIRKILLYNLIATGLVVAKEYFETIDVSNGQRNLPQVGFRERRFEHHRYRRQVTVDQGFKDDAITEHNIARNAVSPAATNMHTAVWNEDLALTAQNYANLCIWEHNDNRRTDTNNRVWSPDSVGENLYMSSYQLTDRQHMVRAVQLWDAEKSDYDLTSNTCSSTNPGCGHFTQVVWHNSAHVGCGIKFCPNLNDSTLVVCNYGPAGNYIGEKPYSTDSSVTPCTQSPCLHGGSCYVSASSYTCSCTSAYSGTNCQTATICASVPCQNGGSCVTNADATSYTCSCAPGFTGNTCETAIPCSSNPCRNGATCTENGATYTCSCQSGYTGSNCETALTSAQFSCGFESSDMCGFTSTGSSFPWQRGSGPTPSPYTGPSAASEGSYYVYTEVSYTWNSDDYAVLESSAIFAEGTRCVRFDYHMYGTSVGTLEVLAGSTVIWSLSGNQNDQWHTQMVDTAALGNNRISFRGIYGGSWSGDISIDNLIISPGACSTSSACSSTPCQNGGTCTNSGSTYTCKCPTSHTGSNCQIAVSACSSGPCQNGGICSPSVSSYTCTCPTSYAGANCQISVFIFTPFYCDFESDLCNMAQASNDDLYWTRTNYIYVTGGSASVKDEAYIETSHSLTATSGSVCIQFLFSMVDGTLQVGSRSSTGSDYVHNLNYNTGNYWYTYNLSVGWNWINSRKLFFKAIIGSSSSSFAIDNISVTQGACPSSKKRQFKTQKSEEGHAQRTDRRKEADPNPSINKNRHLQAKRRLISLLQKYRSNNL